MLHVLGKTTDEKGSQLEKLTFRLLENLGCRNIVINQIGPGGSEIDLSAEFPLPTLAGRGATFIRVICECKAHQEPQKTPDWLKFLGKIYVETTGNPRVKGYFISLSGVNGNVSGSYEALRNAKADIEIVSGDDLIERVSEIYHVAQSQVISSALQRDTQRRARSRHLLYYNEEVYWYVEFDSNVFTLLNAQGGQIPKTVADLLIPMVKQQMTGSSFIDLCEEANAQARTSLVEKVVIGALMLANGEAIELKDIAAANQEGFTPPLSEGELNSAANGLCELGFIEQDSANKTYRFKEGVTEKAEERARLLSRYVQGQVPISPIGCQWYDNSIDMSLLEYIISMQKGVMLTKEDEEKVLALLRLSPNALAWALRPDPRIVNHRPVEGPQSKEIEEGDRAYFLGKLAESFKRDFTSGPLFRYFMDQRSIRQIQSDYRLVIKSNSENTLSIDWAERHGIFQWEEDDGTVGRKYVLVGLIPGFPEPWEKHPLAPNMAQEASDAETNGSGNP